MKTAQLIRAAAPILLLALAACRGDDRESYGLPGEQPGAGDPDAPIEFIVSRSTTGGVQGQEAQTVFNDGNEIGIRVDGYEEYSNVKYKYRSSDGKFVPAEPDKAIFFGQGKKEEMKEVTYTAYYPYNEDASTYDNPAIQGDQSEAERYYTSDALIATGRLGEPMKFTHRMAKVYITTNAPVEYVAVLDQPLTIDGSGELWSPYALSVNNENTEWRVVLVPGKRDITMAIQIGDKMYYAGFGEKELVAGHQYTYNINVGPNLDLSKGDVILNEPGDYTVIQSAGGVTEHCIRIETGGGETTVHLQNVNIKAPTAIYANRSGTTTLILDTKTQVVSTGAGEPGISLDSEIKLNIEGNNQELWATGGPSGYFMPAGPAIGASCNNTGTNNHLYMVSCYFHGKVIGPYTAVIGTCGDVPEQRTRYSMMGNIDIHNSVLYLEQYMTIDQGDYIGNGKIGAEGFGTQHCKVGRIELKECVWEPGDPNLTVGVLRGNFNNGSYKVGNIIVESIFYTETGYGKRPE